MKFIGDLVQYLNYEKGICLSNSFYLYYFNNTIHYISYDKIKASYNLIDEWIKYEE